MCNIYNRDRVVKQPEGTKDLFISHINLYNFSKFSFWEALIVCLHMVYENKGDWLFGKDSE
jgi:hypothetical protein